MILDMKVPSPGESITEVEIAQWLVEDGDYVEKDQEIAEIDSDKATLALPAEESGVIKLLVEDGETVEVGQVICQIDMDAKGESKPKEKDSSAENADAPDPGPAKKEEKKQESTSDQKTYATGAPSPAAKKLMDETGVKLDKGTGKDGRITKDDVVKAAAAMGSGATGSRATERKKMSMLRRKVADRLVSVKNETAMLTTFNEVDMQPIFDLRKKYQERFVEKHGFKLGFMSFFTLASVRALQMYPQVNAMIDGKEVILHDYQDISIAVSGPKGLMVPVLRNAENMSFAGVEREVARLAGKVRDGSISVDDMTGGTFTITNGGVFGSMLSTPIINPPQSAILGMHNIVNRPVAIDGAVTIRPIMYVALSYDHRIIDGRESVSSLVAIKEALENPEEHLMGGNIEKALEI